MNEEEIRIIVREEINKKEHLAAAHSAVSRIRTMKTEQIIAKKYQEKHHRDYLLTVYSPNLVKSLDKAMAINIKYLKEQGDCYENLF